MVKNFIQIFQEQVTRHRNNSIVVTEDDHTTYHELDVKSDKVARFLQSRGMKPEDLVGLCMSLSSEFVICLLGILKAGATYFPIDPTYPEEQLKYILENTKPSLVLVESQFKELLKGYKTIEIDGKVFTSESSSIEPLINISIQPEQLAYVVYTSGSTGKPKGIMVTHASLPNIGEAHRPYYPPNIKMLIAGGVCFDASLLVIFHALMNNSPLYLYQPSQSENDEDLIRFIETYHLEYMICIPTQYARLLQKKPEFHSLKCVSLTGQTVSKSVCQLHASLAPNAILYNEYGPTECAIGATIATIYDPKDRIIRDITAGNPLQNTQIYILDQDQREVPQGVKGEIYISGVGLAQGYLNNPTATAKQFVEISIGEKKITRLYRTGDLGRFLSNGELEFLGRLDHNVEIAGNAINLGEVESYISGCPEVKEATVLIQKNTQGQNYLVAYITAASKDKAVEESLLCYLRDMLPNHMIPSSIIQLDQFPLSPNGKIDRSLLENYCG